MLPMKYNLHVVKKKKIDAPNFDRLTGQGGLTNNRQAFLTNN